MELHSIEKKILLGLLVCLLVSVVGISFAYFTAGVATSGTGSSVQGSTADLIKVSYDAGTNAFSLTDAYPGKSASKNFTVNVTPTDAQPSATYAIKFVIDTNTFVKCSATNYNASTNACIIDANELVYTLKNGAGETVATGDLLGITGEVALATESNKTASTTYTLEIAFLDTGSDQNHNVNKSLTGSIKVEFAG